MLLGDLFLFGFVSGAGHGTLGLTLPRQGLSTELQAQAQGLEPRVLNRCGPGTISTGVMTFKASHLCDSLPFSGKLVSPCT